MDEEALFAVGSVLAAIAGLPERKGICPAMEVAETIGGVAAMTRESGEEYAGRAAYIGSWALMVRAAALNGGGSQHN